MTKLPTIAGLLAILTSSASAGPLHQAVKDGNFAQVEQLIAQGEDVNQSSRRLGTPLHQAAIWANGEMTELLISKGAEIDAEDAVLGTPLAIAARKGNEAVAVILIANGADVHARSANGTTALHQAAEGGHESIIELLVENGVNVNVRTPWTQGTPDYAAIHSAGVNGHFDIVDLLRAYGAAQPPVEPIGSLLSVADPRRGEELFRDACSSCHSIEEGEPARQGPNLWGVLGREKAVVEDFKYSEAFGRLVGTWTLAELSAYIAAPTDYVPGTGMLADPVGEAAQRADLIAFLRQKGDHPPPLPERQ
jgi:cytochrome c